MKIQLVIVFGIIALLASGHGQDQTKQTYCGRRLSQALAWLCENEYSSTLVKRSNYNSLDLGYEPEFSWPWLAKTRGLSDSRSLSESRGLSGPKGKRQIVEECCLQPCTIEVLLTYCGN
ncbi:hypothetical protein MSG28_004919 [Choristoneura fumiferana]|uniref:Uncharacterized protein n=1 Tax=Choristoneura fumiferana TaxID=7141 RepID=A0ACC0JP76_CHOFU|nr:hypothetical protein MSG28_004919 [Choristoneura fumiferana]